MTLFVYIRSLVSFLCLGMGSTDRYNMASFLREMVFFRGIVLVFVLCFPVNNAKSQSVLDSLRRVYNLQKGEERLKTGMVILQYVSDPDEAMFYAESVLNQARELEDSAMIALAWVDLSYIHRQIGDFQTSLNYLNRAYYLAKKTDDYQALIESYTGLGSWYYNMDIYDKALEYHVEALKIKEQFNDIRRLASSYNNIGLIFYKISDFDKALDYYQRAVDVKLQTGDTLGTISNYNNIGLVHSEKGDFMRAIEAFNKAIDISKKYQRDSELGSIYSGLANVYTTLNEQDSARFFLDKAIHIALQARLFRLLSTNYYILGKLDALSGNFKEAIYALSQSQEHAYQLRDKQRIKNNLKLMAEIFGSMGAYDSAYYYQKQFSVLEDSIFNERLAKNLANIQIALTEEQNLKVIEAQELQLLKNKQISLFLISIVALSVTLIVVIFSYLYKVSRINLELSKSKKEIERQNEVLARKNRELGQARDTIDDQNRILKDHNVSLELKVNERTSELVQSNTELEKVIRELDRFIYKTSHDLRGPIATMQGIINLGKYEFSEANFLNYLDKLDGVADTMNNVVHRLIEVHETYQKVLSIDLIDPPGEIMAVIKEFKEKSPNGELRITTDLRQDGEWLSDRVLFRSIIENLIRNASLFIEKQDPFIHVSSRIEGGNLVLEFEDNGFGIQPGDQDKIFSIFFKGSPKPGGTGLEVYTAKIATEKLSGTISLNNPLKNTIFQVVLPPLPRTLST
jgi:signal transduction histidine kinase/Tfp pilus assembly protein PilF